MGSKSTKSIRNFNLRRIKLGCFEPVLNMTTLLYPTVKPIFYLPFFKYVAKKYIFSGKKIYILEKGEICPPSSYACKFCQVLQWRQDTLRKKEPNLNIRGCLHSFYIPGEQPSYITENNKHLKIIKMRCSWDLVHVYQTFTAFRKSFLSRNLMLASQRRSIIRTQIK